MCNAIASWFASLNRSEWFDFISTVVGTVALVSAIAIAIFEHVRAVRSSEQRLSDFRSTVSALVDDLNAKAREIEAHEQDGDTRAAWDAWKVLADDVAEGLKALLPSAPPLPAAIVAVAGMIRRLTESAMFRGVAFDPIDHVRHARSVRVDLEAHLLKLK